MSNKTDKSTVTSLSQRTNKYLEDYVNYGELHLAIDGGALYISVVNGSYVGKVILTQVSQ